MVERKSRRNVRKRKTKKTTPVTTTENRTRREREKRKTMKSNVAEKQLGTSQTFLFLLSDFFLRGAAKGG